MKKLYYVNRFKLILRLFIFVLIYLLAVFNYDLLRTIFFYPIGPLQLFHFFWVLLLIEMFVVCIPKFNRYVSCGKLFLRHHQQPKHPFRPKELVTLYLQNNRSAFLVACFWFLLLAGIGYLLHKNILTTSHLFFISVFFYFADQFCINIWCPFRAWFLHNKCCNTCRIYNWGHFMIFSPLLFIPSFWTYSLIGLSLFILLQWEIMHFLYPERFYEISNISLRCYTCLNAECHYKKGLGARS